MAEYTIAVDLMGGDDAPGCVIDGVKQFLPLFPDTKVLMYGREEALAKAREALGSERAEYAQSGEDITMHDEPMLAVRRKQDSSLMLCMKAVKEGRAQAMVSAGSTGALFLAGMVTLRMLKGIDRPALAAVIPGMEKPVMLIDCGANADCQPAYLKQFGLLGSAYMKQVMGVESPRVGLVNIGAEEEKGSKLYKEAHALMKQQQAYGFMGNVEARDVQSSEADVIVCDGFTGNVILKYAEGLSKNLFKMIKTEALASFTGKLGGLLLRGAFGKIKKRMNKDEYGGAPLLGVNGLVVKAHGSSNAYAFRKALEQARKMVMGDLTGQLKLGLEKLSEE
ncbi:MAG: phosphate acyltransferase PlsX [Clostridia bacterium]|nr:phosphate acyltransferase PlsX [Clostridia bacterium]MBR5985000.1 phosphate acyltransferase PlsX [Clostridia bacterium]